MIDHIFTFLFVAALVSLSIYGLQALLLSMLFLINRNRHPASAPLPKYWSTVTVQLPIFNEKPVVSRLIDCMCHLD